MRLFLIITAAAIVVISTLWVTLSARLNRNEAPGGTVELTERELGLPPAMGDSTALLLDLKWRAPSSIARNTRSPDWLTTGKLTELGFDCRVPVTSPIARDHYDATPPILVFLVLEYEGQASKTALPDSHLNTRLLVIDAGLDPQSLRAKFPDLARHIITRGVISIQYKDRSMEDRSPLPEPRLGGWINSIVPGQIFVPPPFSQSLQALRRKGPLHGNKAAEEPRFVVTVSWGSRYEPWVKAVRLLK